MLGIHPMNDAAAAAAKSLQSCLTLWPGSSVHGIFQARVLEWGAIAFSEWMMVKVTIFGGWELVGGRFSRPQAFLSWGPGPSPVLPRSLSCPPRCASLNQLYYSVLMPRLPSPLWGNGNVVIGGPGERMRKAAFTFSGLKSCPSYSGTLFSLCLQIPADSSPSFSPLPLTTYGHGCSGLDCGDSWTWMKMWRGIKVLGSVVHCW